MDRGLPMGDQPAPQAPPKNLLGAVVAVRSIRLEASETRFIRIQAGEGPATLDLELGGGGGKSVDDPHVLRVIVKVGVTARASDEATQPICEMRAQYALDYEVLEEGRIEAVTAQEVNEFIKSVAMKNAWPYAREFFHSASLKMGIPPIILPSLFGAGPDGAAAVARGPKEQKKE